MDIETILARFPKKRPTLSSEAAAVHEAILKANRERASPLTKISRALESWMHRQAAMCAPLPPAHRLLEIGAGTLNHVPYERAGLIYDVVEPLPWLYTGKPERHRVRHIFDDVSEIPPACIYDRIISIAALEHLTDLPRAIVRSALLLTPGGIFRACIPSESGFLWGLSWRITFALAYKLKTGRNWSEHMRYEHVNAAPEIIAVIRHFFSEVEIRRFPLPLHHLSFYAAIEARAPRQEICRAYLEARGADIRN